MQVPAILTTSPFSNAHISNSHHKAISFMHVPAMFPPQAHFFNAHISQRRCSIMAPETLDDVKVLHFSTYINGLAYFLIHYQSEQTRSLQPSLLVNMIMLKKPTENGAK